MSSAKLAAKQPIIIKKRRIVKGDDHHGGAWKVAYADFVTAMMAFFLLMWLLNATTEEQRKGIADYFNPTIPISRISGGGSDGLNGSSIFSEETYAKMGTGATRERSVERPATDAEKHKPLATSSEEATKIADDLASLKDRLEKEGTQLSEHLLIKMSPEGIVLEVIDSDSTPLFKVGRSEPSEVLIDILTHVAEAFGAFDNDIKIVGHTDDRRYRNDAVYDNWNLSSDRANAARRLLLRAGFNAARIREVAGKADIEPLVPEDPSAAQNRRISITILND